MTITIADLVQTPTTFSAQVTFTVNSEIAVIPTTNFYLQGGFYAVRAGGGSFNVDVRIVASLADLTDINTTATLGNLTQAATTLFPTADYIGGTPAIWLKLISGGGAAVTVYIKFAK